jgi:plastocyanin
MRDQRQSAIAQGTIKLSLATAMVLAGITITGCKSNEPAQAQTQKPAPVATTPPPQLNVEIKSPGYVFEPSEVVAAPGQKVKITLVNTASGSHSVGVRLPSGEIEMDQPVPGGKSGTLEFTAPDAPGEYVLFCPLGSHEQRGMKGKLIVRKP